MRENTTEFHVLQTFIDIKTTNTLAAINRCNKTTFTLRPLFLLTNSSGGSSYN